MLIFFMLVSLVARGQSVDDFKATSAIASMERDAHARMALRKGQTAASGNFTTAIKLLK
jgi:hypothetical protein